MIPHPLLAESFLHAWLVPPEATVEPWLYIATAVVAMTITAVSKGGFGGGVGIVSVPLMLQVAPYQFVVGMWLPVLIACDIATIHRYPKEWSPRAFVKLAPGVLLGIALTTWFLSGIDPQAPPAELKHQEAWLKLGVALIAFVFVALQFRPKKQDAASAEPWRPSWLASTPIGFLAGVTTMIAHAAGTIVTMFFLPMKLDQRVFVGTTGRFFFTFNTLKIPFFVAIGFMTLATFKQALWLMLLAPLGVGFGSWLNRRLSASRFIQLIYLFLVLACLKLVYDWWKAVMS
ncbi:MAG: sulfite exporter TauE/SafE family protein [Planctomycetota bacterium]|nr:sulfite exporter TauE/SafE family protein [Planctomycetota bacterium]